jgi:hypothetical protein
LAALLVEGQLDRRQMRAKMSHLILHAVASASGGPSRRPLTSFRMWQALGPGTDLVAQADATSHQPTLDDSRVSDSLVCCLVTQPTSWAACATRATWPPMWPVMRLLVSAHSVPWCIVHPVAFGGPTQGPRGHCKPHGQDSANGKSRTAVGAQEHCIIRGWVG